MKWKLTFGVFAVIILTVEAIVSRYDRSDQSRLRYDLHRIRSMVRKIDNDIAADNIWVVSVLPNSLMDQWKQAIKGVYTEYRVTISKKGGPTVIETVELDPVLSTDDLGHQYEIHGTVFRTSEEFPDLTIDVDWRSITKQTKLIGNFSTDVDNLNRFVAGTELLTARAALDWPNELFDRYEVSAIKFIAFHADGILSDTLRLNPNEGLVLRDYDRNDLTNEELEELDNRLNSEIKVFCEFTISERGGSTLIDQFDVLSLDFGQSHFRINNIAFNDVTPNVTDVRLALEFSKLKISANCHSTTRRNENIHGIYNGPDIVVTFDKLIVLSESRWHDDGPDHSRIDEAKIINLFVKHEVEMTVWFDPRMGSVIQDMLISMDGLVQELFKEIETNMKQSAEVKGYLKTFLQHLFYDELEQANDEVGPPSEGNNDAADVDWSLDFGFSDE